MRRATLRRVLGWGLLVLLVVGGLLCYVVIKPDYDRARADYQRLLDADGGTVELNGAPARMR